MPQHNTSVSNVSLEVHDNAKLKDFVIQSSLTRRLLIPLLSCWEGQAEGVDQGSERGKTRLNRCGMGMGDERQPGK